MIRIAIVIIALAGTARADEIASGGPQIAVPIEKPPAPPRPTALGVLFGASNTQVADHDRTLITIGATWDRELARRVHAVAEYQWCLVMGTAHDPMMTSPWGRAHVVRAGLRVDALSKTIENRGRIYAAVEGAAGALYGGDTELGTYALPNALAAVRFGAEIFARETSSPSKTFDMYLRFGALLTRADAGFVFQLGLGWGR